MQISLIGDMIEVSDEELEAIGYVSEGCDHTKKVGRGLVIKYITEAFQEQVNADVELYRDEVRIAKAAQLRVQAKDLNDQADALSAATLEIPEDQ